MLNLFCFYFLLFTYQLILQNVITVKPIEKWNYIIVGFILLVQLVFIPFLKACMLRESKVFGDNFLLHPFTPFATPPNNPPHSSPPTPQRSSVCSYIFAATWYLPLLYRYHEIGVRRSILHLYTYIVNNNKKKTCSFNYFKSLVLLLKY